MHNNIKRISSILISFIFLLVLTSCKNETIPTMYSPNFLVIHYIDIGQGDSILIQVNGKNMLIDAGSKSNTNKLIHYLNKQHIKKFDYVIATHPHEDHIGGMNKVIDNFKIAEFYAPKVTANTDIFHNMITSLNNKSLKINVATSGLLLDLGSDIKCEILAPNSSFYKDVNNYSAVIKITYKNNSFLFTGDAQKLSEDEILKNGDNALNSTVLKVGHHGSRTSTSDEFLKEVSPKIAIISCGSNNDFGHPHKPTLYKLQTIKAKTYRTDKNGTVVLFSDGNKISKK